MSSPGVAVLPDVGQEESEPGGIWRHLGSAVLSTVLVFLAARAWQAPSPITMHMPSPLFSA